MSRGSFAIRDPKRSEFLEARAQYEFEPNFSRPGAYFRALAMSPQIFARKGKLKRIYHLGLEAYYLALMRLEDLGVALAELSAATPGYGAELEAAGPLQGVYGFVNDFVLPLVDAGGEVGGEEAVTAWDGGGAPVSRCCFRPRR